MLAYYLIRTLTFPLRWISYSWLYRLGNVIGLLSFYCIRKYRKRALSNLALATDLQLNNQEIIQTAKQSFQNLAINCLEYVKLDVEKTPTHIRCENPDIAQNLYAKGQGLIFFCGHQANWEALFLDGTSRMKGIAIGKSIKNKRLYNWIVSIREKYGGKIILPRNAIREGFRALKQGKFVGIVGDQGMPESGYSFPFLGRRAWTSTAPALLSYRTNSPIIFANVHRDKTGYTIHYSDPIWPNTSNSMEQEVTRIMDKLLTLLQEGIKRAPGQWLWQHNRWKQQASPALYKRFRHDCIGIILPNDPQKFAKITPHLATLKNIYPGSFFSLIVPKIFQKTPLIEADETIYYDKTKETKLNDFRFKLIFNFTDDKTLSTHYEKLSAFEVLDLARLKTLAGETGTLSEMFTAALCKPLPESL